MPRAAWPPALIALAVLGGGCGGGGEAGGEALPRVDLIEPAVEAIESERGGEVEFFEISATLDQVDAIVRDGEQGVLYRYDGNRLSGPVEPRPDTRQTFTSDAIDIEPDKLFDRVTDELADAAVVDFAIHVDGGVVVNDATLATDRGGVMLVLLGGDGTIGGLQAG
jgi:hypothetical protein